MEEQEEDAVERTEPNFVLTVTGVRVVDISLNDDIEPPPGLVREAWKILEEAVGKAGGVMDSYETKQDDLWTKPNSPSEK